MSTDHHPKLLEFIKLYMKKKEIEGINIE